MLSSTLRPAPLRPTLPDSRQAPARSQLWCATQPRRHRSRTWVEARRNPRLSKSVAGSADATLTDAECQHDILEFTGAITANINSIVKAIDKQWTVANKTTGAFSLTIKGPSGTGITIAQGTRAIVYHDGTYVVRASADV